MEFADIQKSDVVIDAYCGTGTIGIIASKFAGQVLGIELNKDAVKDAKLNAKINNVENINFICADAGKYMVELAKNKEHADVVIMDPPRAGSDRRFINAVATLAPEKIVYISCNPETLERDLTYFARKGYYAHRIPPVDMFPHTNHVEAVALLSRKEISKFNGVMKNER
jgi:23S rRNA (uracil1939-C5)-methyltransferase